MLPVAVIGELADRVAGRVRSELDTLYHVGLERDFLATNKGMGYRRLHTRYGTACPGIFIVGGRKVACIVVNISEGGAKIRLKEPVQAAVEVRLRIEQVGELPGRVVWRDDTDLGVQFLDPLKGVERLVAVISKSSPG